jgi:hypothetical protein
MSIVSMQVLVQFYKSMKLVIFIFIILLNYGCSNSTTSKQIKEGLENRANKAYDSNYYEVAIPLFDSLIVNDSTRGELYFKRGYSHMMKKDKNPINSLQNINTKEEYLNMKEARDAPTIKDFLKAINLGYKRKVAFLNIGVIYTFLNDSIALDYFIKSLQEDSNYGKAKYEVKLCKERIKTNQHFY